MNRSIVVASDLDRTLIYSRSASGLEAAVAAADLVTVEHLDGAPLSFMTTAAAALLAELAAEHVFVPVTTRTPAQLARVRLPGPPARHAVAANGGVLLVDGVVDEVWSAVVRTAVDRVAPLADAVAVLSAVCDPAWSSAPRVAADLFCYVVLDRALLPAETVTSLRTWAGPAGWSVSVQGRKLYLVPGPLRKSAAVAEVARRIGASRIVAAGDSLLDIDLLLAADLGVHPGHGEIAESGWSAPTVERLTASGARAAEEILAWFFRAVRALEPAGASGSGVQPWVIAEAGQK